MRHELPELLPPQSLEAEMAVLGAALISATAVERMRELLEREDFYLEAHRKVYDVMLFLAERAQPVDVLSVPEELRRRDWLEACGGLAQISALAESVPTAAHVEYYARRVREKSLLRKLIAAAGEITAQAYAEEAPADEIADRAEERILAVRSARDAVEEAEPMAEVVGRMVTWLHPDLPQERGLSTGFGKLDALTGGMMPQELIIGAARPSMGKTSIGVVQLALNLARRGTGVLIYSLEMKKPALTTRFLANLSGIDSLQILTRRYTDRSYWPRVQDAMDELQLLPISVHDRGSVRPQELPGHARREARAHPEIGLVIIDHVHEFDLDPKLPERLALKLAVKTIKKRVAEPLRVPVVLLAQLSRNVEAKERRGDRRPQMSDLRESGSLEEHADTIWMFYRHGYYEVPPGGDEPDEGETELIVRKSRLGRRGTCRLRHHLPTSHYAPLELRARPEAEWEEGRIGRGGP